jgi:hypothetical protein
MKFPISVAIRLVTLAAALTAPACGQHGDGTATPSNPDAAMGGGAGAGGGTRDGATLAGDSGLAGHPGDGPLSSSGDGPPGGGTGGGTGGTEGGTPPGADATPGGPTPDGGGAPPGGDGGGIGGPAVPLFVGTGAQGNFVSVDGKVWHPVANPGPTDGGNRFDGFSQLVFAAGRFIGCGPGIWASKNGYRFERVFPQDASAPGRVSNLVNAGRYWIAQYREESPGSPVRRHWVVSEDGGVSWVRRNEDTMGFNFDRLVGHDDVLLGLAPATGNRNAQLWLSSDRGAGWAPIEPGPDPLKPVLVDHLHDFIQGRFVATATGGRWFESPNGKDWTAIDLLGAPGTQPQDFLVIHPVLDVNGRILAGSMLNGHLLASTDNGKTWKGAGGLDGSFLTYGNNVYVADPGVRAGASPHFTTDPLEKDDWQPISWTGSTRPHFKAVAFGLPQAGP